MKGKLAGFLHLHENSGEKCMVSVAAKLKDVNAQIVAINTNATAPSIATTSTAASEAAAQPSTFKKK